MAKRMTQLDHFNAAHRQIAGVNATFMELVNHPTNPLTREDLAANIERRPALWGRFAGFLKTLPPRGGGR
jgi:capsid protein